eukprot:scaffold188611_cov66-Cyclotella_meneghiniana.AAC.1
MFMYGGLDQCFDQISNINEDDDNVDEISIDTAEYEESDVIEGLGFLVLGVFWDGNMGNIWPAASKDCFLTALLWFRWEFWLNDTSAGKNWEVFTPQGHVLTFYLDTAVCSGMLILDMTKLRVDTPDELQHVKKVRLMLVRIPQQLLGRIRKVVLVFVAGVDVDVTFVGLPFFVT